MNTTLTHTAPTLSPTISGLRVELSVRIGTTNLTVRELTELTEGSLVSLNESGERPLELCANGQVVARGVLEEAEDGKGLALRVTEAAGSR